MRGRQNKREEKESMKGRKEKKKGRLATGERVAGGVRELERER